MGGRLVVIHGTMRQICKGKVLMALPILLFLSTGWATRGGLTVTSTRYLALGYGGPT